MVCVNIRLAPRQRTAPAVYPRNEPQSYERWPSPEAHSKRTGSPKDSHRECPHETHDSRRSTPGDRYRIACRFGVSPSTDTRPANGGYPTGGRGSIRVSPSTASGPYTSVEQQSCEKTRTETDLAAPTSKIHTPRTIHKCRTWRFGVVTGRRAPYASRLRRPASVSSLWCEGIHAPRSFEASCLRTCSLQSHSRIHWSHHSEKQTEGA